MLHLRVLGGIDLVDHDGGDLLQGAQPKRLAVLAYLAIQAGDAFVRRDALLATFWPELDTNHARSALRKALHYLRELVGSDVITSRGDELVGIDRALLSCDAHEFRSAVARGALQEALEHYRGSLLPGFHIADAPAFDQWVEQVRGSLREAAAGCALELGRREQRAGRQEAARRWASRAVDIAPLDERCVSLFVETLQGSGDVAGALHAYERYRKQLWDELEIAPSPALQELATRASRTSIIASEAKGSSTEGPVVTRQVAKSEPEDRKRLSRTYAIVGAAAMVLLAGGLVKMIARSTPPTDAGTSLAVLPFANVAGDTAQEYFVEGLTHTLARELARIPALRVASTTSVGRYAQAKMSVSAICDQLDVSLLLEGAVVRSGDRVRVTTQLFDCSSDARVWSESFEHQLGDILSLYSAVARAVAREIRITVADSDRSSRAASALVHPAAYEALLHGTYFRRRWMAGGCVPAERYLMRAIALDSTLAEAHAALAFCYASPDRLRRPITEILPKARAALSRALALDPALASAYHVLGFVRHRLEYDWAGAREAYGRAVDLDPRDSDGLRLAGEVRYLSGETEAGLAMMRRALEIDPFHLDNNVALGYGLQNLRRFDEAITQFERTLELDANYVTGRFWLADTYVAKGDRNRGVSEYLGWLRGSLRPDSIAPVTSRLLERHQAGGWTAFWDEDIRLCQREDREPGSLFVPPYGRYCSPFYMSRRHARLGRVDLALAALEIALEQRHHLIPFLGVDPAFDAMRHDPRFRRLMRRASVPCVRASC